MVNALSATQRGYMKLRAFVTSDGMERGKLPINMLLHRLIGPALIVFSFLVVTSCYAQIHVGHMGTVTIPVIVFVTKGGVVLCAIALSAFTIAVFRMEHAQQIILVNARRFGRPHTAGIKSVP